MNQYAEHTKKCKSIIINISTTFIWIQARHSRLCFLNIQAKKGIKYSRDEDYIHVGLYLEMRIKDMVYTGKYDDK